MGDNLTPGEPVPGLTRDLASTGNRPMHDEAPGRARGGFSYAKGHSQ